MKKRALTFAEAFRAMIRGCIVANDEIESDRFREHGANFQVRTVGADGWRPMVLVEEEIDARWRIVPTKGRPRA